MEISFFFLVRMLAYTGLKFTKSLPNMLHGVMDAAALEMAYFSLDRHLDHKLLRVFSLEMGCKVGVIFHVTLQSEAALRYQSLQKQNFLKMKQLLKQEYSTGSGEKDSNEEWPLAKLRKDFPKRN